MNQQHEIATTDRNRDLLYDMAKLSVPLDYYAKLHPTDYAAEEAARRAKEEAKKAAHQDGTGTSSPAEGSPAPQAGA